MDALAVDSLFVLDLVVFVVDAACAGAVAALEPAPKGPSFITTPGVSGVNWDDEAIAAFPNASPPPNKEVPSLSFERDGSGAAVAGAGGGGIDRSTGEGESTGAAGRDCPLLPWAEYVASGMLYPFDPPLDVVSGLVANAFPAPLLLLDREPRSSGVEVVDFDPL